MKHIVEPMIALYGELGTDDAEMVADLYERLLAGFSDAALAAAFHAVSGTYMPSKRNPWPAPAFFRRAAEKHAAEHAAQAQRQPVASGHAALAMQAVRSDLGAEAAREGWILGLHDFVVRHGRAPKPHEIGELMAAADFVARTAAGAVEMGFGRGPLMALADTLLAKRERLAKIALGEEA